MCPKYFVGLLLILIFYSVSGQAPSSEQLKKEAFLLKQAIQNNHYKPRAIDDEFSAYVFEHLLEELDPYRLYFTEADLKSIEKYKTLIDDELNGKGWSFLKETTELYRKCLQRSEKNIAAILQKPFTWTQHENPLQLDHGRWTAGEQENNRYWVRWLKYKTLSRLYALTEQQGQTSLQSNFPAQHEAEARKQVHQSEAGKIQRTLNGRSGLEVNVATAFYKTVAASFDPHTAYLSTVDLMNFIRSLSSEGFSFGLVLTENDKGEVVISYLVPGGPAWKSGELNTSDALVYLRWDEDELIDLYGLSLDEIGELLDESDQRILELTVRKTSGVQKTVRLRKEKLGLEENVVRSFMLKGEKTIGYISLPGFYSDWGEEREGGRCASDVAREIVKLNRAKVDGLILDVRYNGGGSLKEAIEMAGIFIDQGPLCVVSDRTGEFVTLKDLNRGTVYSGPLVVMVNRQSASASELLAAALQDYNRAIIVGSRTFGKASAQNIHPLDPRKKDFIKELISPLGTGFASITLGRIYRITGKTAQGYGVIPDVILPDVLDSLNIHEAFLPLALPADSIEKKTYYQPLSPLPLSALKDESACRVDSNHFFKVTAELSQWLAIQIEKRKHIPLNWPGFVEAMSNRTEKYKEAERLAAMHQVPFHIENHESDISRMQIDQFMKEMNDRLVKNLSSDIYLEEAFHIICDYIRLTKK